LHTPEPITNLERLDLKGQREAILILAALTNGDVRMYRGKDLVDVLRVGERIAALACGPYSREVNTLCLVTKAGGLIVKMLPRRHELATATYGGGPPPEQDIPLDIPKKTKLYLDQTEREREMAPEMHRRFQRETVNLQVTTAKAYLELLQRGEIAGASVATEKKEDTKEEEEDKVLVDLRAVVKGLGPFFHLEVEVANLGDESLLQIPILLSYNPEKYKSPKPLIQIGALVPGIPLKCIFELECLDPSATDEEVEIQVLPSQLDDVLRETDRLESDVNFSALVMSRVTMPQSSML
jgi:Bardet-Biedl syndrome 1 protein